MTNGFSTNVAARKPRTGLARVISDMVAPQPAEQVEMPAPPVLEVVKEVPQEVKVEAASAPAATSAPTAQRRAVSGREQVERLRERLAAAARPATGEVEPEKTAAAVREVIEGLRARLETSQRERTELANQLEEMRASLAHAETELRKERRTRAAIETQAEERKQIADDAVAEAEALAEERDQMLADLAEQRRLESEQSALLLEAETVLGRRDAERSAAAKQLAEAHEQLDLRTAEVADLEARLRAEAAERARTDLRCRELESEVRRLAQATEALEAIEGMTRGR